LIVAVVAFAALLCVGIVLGEVGDIAFNGRIL
jgi:hypothetical protein